MRVRADNDAFDFWMPAWDRPDEEYTSGVKGTLEYAGQAWWGRFLNGTLAPCGAGVDRCATRTYSLGQDIYTGALQDGQTTPPAGSRPPAGWLYLEEKNRAATTNSLNETSLTLGVTGPPSLAEFTQRTVHSIAPVLNRPIDWNDQIPFEPGAVVRYERTQRVLATDDGARFGADLEPHAGASLGEHHYRRGGGGSPARGVRALASMVGAWQSVSI